MAIPQLKKHRYLFVWGNIQTMLTIENNTYAFVHRKDNPWHVERDIIEFSRENRIEAYYSEEDFARSEEVGKMFLDEMQYRKFIENMQTDVRDCWEYYGRLKRIGNFEELDTDTLLGLFKEGQERWRSVIGHFKATQPQGINALLTYVKSKVSPEELPILLLSPELDAANEEVLDWWQLAQQPFSERAVIEHAYTYPWIAAMHFTYKDVIDSLKGRYDFDSKHRAAPHIREEKRELTEKQKPLFEKCPELVPHILRLQRLSLSRMEIKAAWAGMDFYLIPIINEIARRTGESVRDLNLYYMVDEIISLVRDGKTLPQRNKDARKRCFVGLIQDGQVYYFEGEEAEGVVKQVLGDRGEKMREAKGVAAYKGKVTGVVRILHANDVERSRELRSSFKQGEILVTEMTQPNIMDIASRAGAIVTDEGILLSHAAIVARELKIPCVVGTGAATKAFRDGDVVEVDAERGIVKII